MSQTKLGSIAEATFNMAVGYVFAVLTQAIIFPLFDIHVPLSDNILMAGLFTIISLIRNYAIRRLFNAAPWLKFKGSKNAQN